MTRHILVEHLKLVKDTDLWVRSLGDCPGLSDEQRDAVGPIRAREVERLCETLGTAGRIADFEFDANKIWGSLRDVQKRFVFARAIACSFHFDFGSFLLIDTIIDDYFAMISEAKALDVSANDKFFIACWCDFIEPILRNEELSAKASKVERIREYIN